MFEVTAYRKGPNSGTYDGRGSKYHMFIRREVERASAERLALDLVETRGYHYATVEEISK